MAKVEELVIHCETNEALEELDKIKIKLEQVYFLTKQLRKAGIRKKFINKILLNKIKFEASMGDEEQ